MATNNAVNDSSAPFTVSTGDLTLTDGTLKIKLDTNVVKVIKYSDDSTFISASSVGSGAQRNLYIGYLSCNPNPALATGQRNVGIGANSLAAITSAYRSLSFGAYSMQKLTTGYCNTSVGTYGLGNLTTGNYNTALGDIPAFYLATGSYNVCIGYSAGDGTTGVDSIHGSGYAYTSSESSNLIIMNDGVIGESNKIRIGTQGTGNGQQNATYIAGIYNTAVGATAGVVLSDSAHKLGGLAGSAGQVLQGGTKPAFSTATYPATIAIGEILHASAANVISALTAGTANYVLTAHGAGNAVTWEAAAGGGIGTLAGDSGTATGATVTIAGGTNLTSVAGTATVTINLDAAISGTTSHVFANAGYLGTGTTAADTLLLRAYNVNGTAYTTFATLTAHATTPTMDLASAVTINSSYIYRASGTDVPVADGGTGASTLTQNGVLLGNATSAVGATAEGSTGKILTGVTGNAPAWTTATYPATIAKGEILHASAANVISALTAGTADYVLTAHGAGNAVTWEALGAYNNILLPTTTSTVGQIKINSVPVFHTYGTENIFIGSPAGNFTTTGAGRNIGIGLNSLVALTSGEENSFLGYYSGYSNTSGHGNTCFGGSAGNAITVSNYNTLIGYKTGYVLTGTLNTGIGFESLYGITTGSYNCALGQNSGGALTGDDHSNLDIVNNGTEGDVHTIRIGTQGTGNGQQNATYIAGIYNTAVGGTAGVVLSDSVHKLGGLAGAANTVLQGGTAPSFAAIDLSTAIVSSTLPPARGGRNSTSESTTSNTVQMAINTTYIATSTNGATLVTYTLPSTAAVGDQVKVIGKSTAFWKVAQNATDTIFYGAATSTPGNTGYATTAQIYASATFTCITASSIWAITEFAGTVTLV